MKTELMFSSATDKWNTPPDLERKIRAFLGDYFDPFPSDPHGADLQITWHGPVFMNPPYGRQIGIWTHKALCSGLEVVMLVPARTETAWFDALFKQCSICFIRGRLKFSGCRVNAPFPSALAYRGPRAGEFREVFAEIGNFA